MGISLLLEISNNLPALAQIPPEVHLYLRQQEMLRYLAFDVSRFSQAYAAIFVYALVYFRPHRWLAYTIFASLGLWFAPPCGGHLDGALDFRLCRRAAFPGPAGDQLTERPSWIGSWTSHGSTWT